MQLTLKQIAEQTNLSFACVRKRALREGWGSTAETVINHKPARLFDSTTLPEDLRLKLEPTQKGLSTRRAPAAEIPEVARVTALARFDLLRHWQDWRATHPGKVGSADLEFVSAVNSGTLFPALHNTLGDISIKTLYRWFQMLDGSHDWMRLVPAYYGRGRGGEPVLSQAERDIFMGLLLQPNKPSIGTACRLVNFSLQKQGLEVVHSPATFRRYAEHFKSQHYDRWVFLREGTKALRDKVEPFIRRDVSQLNVGDVLIADGHRLNFQVINPFSGKPCRATLVGYLDWKSYYLAGYYIMIEENTQCIAAALRDAVMNLGKMPKVCYQDNGRAFRARFFTGENNKFDECGLDGLFARLGICAVFAQPYNARAKIIEGWFKEFSNTFERLMTSYTGSSIEDKPAWTKRNETWHRVRHNGYIPTITEAIEMIAQWLEFAGSQPCPHVEGKTRKQVFDEGRGPGVAAAELDDLMMQETIGYIGRHGIRFLGADYYSDELYGLKQRAIIRYSLLNLNEVKVYTEKEGFLCVAGRVETVHPMARLANAQSQEEITRVLAAHKRLENRTMATADHELGRISAPYAGQPHTQAKPQEQLPASETELPTDLHIPENAVNPTPVNETPELGRPFMNSAYERYQWHLQNGCKDEVDRAWMEAYKSSDEYQMISAANEA